MGDVAEVGPHTAATIAREGLILKVNTGSKVSGINPEGGDIDQIGVALEPPHTVTGLDRFEQHQYRDADKRVAETPGQSNRSQEGELDLTVYSARKFVRLAGRGNPSLLEVLFTPGDQIVDISFPGSELLVNKRRFISKQAGFRYLGYMDSQIKAMTGENRKHTNRPELIEKHGYDTKFAAHAWRLGWQGIELMNTHQINLPLLEEPLGFARDVRQGRMTFEDVVLELLALRERLNTATMGTTLPPEADWAWITEWLHRSHMDFWRTL